MDIRVIVSITEKMITSRKSHIDEYRMLQELCEIAYE